MHHFEWPSMPAVMMCPLFYHAFLLPCRAFECVMPPCCAAGAIWNRMVDAAKRFGLYRGQSVHSFRRGSMQHHKESGMAPELVAQRAKIKTPEVAARYLNKRRSYVKLAKKERAAKAARMV